MVEFTSVSWFISNTMGDANGSVLEPSRDEYPAGTASVRTGGCGGYTETLWDILSFVSLVGQSQSPRFQVSRCLFNMFQVMFNHSISMHRFFYLICSHVQFMFNHAFQPF